MPGWTSPEVRYIKRISHAHQELSCPSQATRSTLYNRSSTTVGPLARFSFLYARLVSVTSSFLSAIVVPSCRWQSFCVSETLLIRRVLARRRRVAESFHKAPLAPLSRHAIPLSTCSPLFIAEPLKSQCGFYRHAAPRSVPWHEPVIGFRGRRSGSPQFPSARHYLTTYAVSRLIFWGAIFSPPYENFTK
ncbi:hypothetical protein BDY21DRAFT_96654 [Lineolata rhizophorae]|uniref:Uncharacterized protein n=1 Tax=Lineolata rhizophorae TaxID=578093 RepID=A0A6A6NUF4_9PEZI|nr:hypothetical protein BDY21DRAFT_96654 [Lineolata rhizophorae]